MPPFPQVAQLEQQAFAGVPCAQPYRFHTLQNSQCIFDSLGRNMQVLGCNVDYVFRQESVMIEAADQVFRNLTVCWGQ